jgi:hypothetical protein
MVALLLAPLPAAPAATKFVVNPHSPSELFDEAEPTAPLLLLVAAISTAPPISRAFFALTPNSSRLIYLFATRLCYYRLLFGIFTSHTFTLSSSAILHRISTANFYHYTIGVLKSP